MKSGRFISDEFIRVLRERERSDQAMQQLLDDRDLTDDERRRIAAFQVQTLHFFRGCEDNDWVLEMKGSEDFDLLRDAAFPDSGPHDVAKHLFGGHGRALCGATTGQRAFVRGEVFYCVRATVLCLEWHDT